MIAWAFRLHHPSCPSRRGLQLCICPAAAVVADHVDQEAIAS